MTNAQTFVLCKRYTPAWRLFNLRYKCLATHLIEVTTEYLATGNAIMNVTGDKQVDALSSGRMEIKNLTAAAIAMFMDEGHAIAITNMYDCVQIYNDIQDHLHNHLQASRQAFHKDDLPAIEELRQFEALALEVYNTAKRLEPRAKSPNGSSIFDSFIEMSRRRNLIATNRFLKGQSETNGEIRPYISIVDDIELNMAELN